MESGLDESRTQDLTVLSTSLYQLSWRIIWYKHRTNQQFLYNECTQTTWKEKNPNKKWNLVGMSLEHRTLPLWAPCSTNWANGPFDTNIEQSNNFYTMSVPKLIKKRVIQIKIEIWPWWVTNTGPYRYEHLALPTELTDHLIQTRNKLTIFIQWMYPN